MRILFRSGSKKSHQQEKATFKKEKVAFFVGELEFRKAVPIDVIGIF